MTADRSSSVVPKRRFPEFRDAPEWRTPYGDTLFDSVNNRSAAPGLPVLAITQEHGAIPRDQIDYHVSVTAESVASYKEVCEGDFIISLRSFQGGIEHSRYHGICSPAYVILRRKGGGNDHFFRHLFKSERFIQQLTRNIEGIRDGKMISYAQFSEQLLPVPEPPEQQKIADCLGSLDDLTAAEIRKLDALRQHKQGLMQQLFPQPGETVPRLRFPEFQNAGAWEEEKLDDLARRGTGHTPKKAIAEYYDGGIKWVSLADSKRLDNGLISETEIEISEEGINNSSAVLHPAGSVILSRDAGVGKSAIISCSMAVSQHFIVWTCEPTVLSNWFLYYQLQLLKPLFERIATGSTIKTIGLPFFNAMRVTVPRPAEQHRIADCLSMLEARLAAQVQKLNALKTHKQGLLQQLFPPLESQ